MFGSTKKCKIEGCNNPIWGNRLCVNHKPRKSLPQSKLNRSVFSAGNVKEISEMKEFFFSIWKNRPHYSEVSNDYLGSEPLTVFFHHILPKEKYPEAKYDENNIILLTFDEHTNVEMDVYRYEEINKRRELLKLKYERT